VFVAGIREKLKKSFELSFPIKLADKYLRFSKSVLNFIIKFCRTQEITLVMKKQIIISILFFAILCNSSGQWYYKKYKVTEISDLSSLQLEESLENEMLNLRVSRYFVFAGACGLAAGTVMIANNSATPVLPGEDPSNFMAGLYFTAGLGFAAGGLAYAIVSRKHINHIKTAQRQLILNGSSLNIHPEFLPGRRNEKFVPVISLFLSF